MFYLLSSIFYPSMLDRWGDAVMKKLVGLACWVGMLPALSGCAPSSPGAGKPGAGEEAPARTARPEPPAAPPPTSQAPSIFAFSPPRSSSHGDRGNRERSNEALGADARAALDRPEDEKMNPKPAEDKRGRERGAGSEGDSARDSKNPNDPSGFKRLPLPSGLPGWFAEKDKDADGQVGMYEWPKDKLDEFAKHDRNGDGLITIEEAMGPAAKTTPVLPPFDPTWIFELMDRNRDGVVTRDDVADKAAWSHYEQYLRPSGATDGRLTREGFLKAFREAADKRLRSGKRDLFGDPKDLHRLLDQNGDGKLDPAELQRIRQLQSDLRRWDGSGDGMVDATEFRSFLDAMSLNHRPPAAREPGKDLEFPVDPHRFFDSMDRSRDGVVTREDAIDRQTWNRFEDYLVRSGSTDGRLTREGFLKAFALRVENDLRANKKEAFGDPKYVFEVLDANRDGLLFSAELQPARRLQTELARWDANGDGAIDGREFTGDLEIFTLEQRSRLTAVNLTGPAASPR